MRTLRVATAADSDALLAIYAPYITDTAVTFETAIPSSAEFRRRVEEIVATYPFLIAEEDGQPVGYAYAHRESERAAYDWNAELSVYVKNDHRGKGVGRQLYAALLRLLQLQGVQNAYVRIALPNPESEKLHARMGFRRLAEHRATGYKHGAWHSILWMEKTVGDHAIPPAPLIPFSQLSSDAVSAVLALADDTTAAPLQPLPVTVGGRYRHFKGREYRVLSLATDSETGEPVVVYQQLYGEGGVWVRPAAMFTEAVFRDGRWILRFAPVEEQS